MADRPAALTPKGEVFHVQVEQSALETFQVYAHSEDEAKALAVQNFWAGQLSKRSGGMNNLAQLQTSTGVSLKVTLLEPTTPEEPSC